jgi:hypothetical protein
VKNEVNTSVDSASFGRLKINRQNWVAQNAPIPRPYYSQIAHCL